MTKYSSKFILILNRLFFYLSILFFFSISANTACASRIGLGINKDVHSYFQLINISAVIKDYNGFSVSCNGASDGEIDITPTAGIPPYTFVWSSGQTTEDVTGLSAGTYTVTVFDNIGDSQTETYNLTEPTFFSVSENITPVSCFNQSNGIISLTVSGSVPNYSFQWSNSATTQDLTGVTAGTYTVTITDVNLCTTSASYIVSEPVALSIIESITNVNCNGETTGAIDLTVSGGTPNYTYLWSNSSTTQDLTGVAAGTYTVTVIDANLCTSSTSYTVSQPTTLTLTSAIINVNCNGATTGTIDLSVSGGTPNYTYFWSNSATTQDLTGIAAGTYTVTVTDASLCTSSASYTVSQPTTLALTSAITNVNCNGATTGAIDLTVSGGTPNYTYLWSNSATTQDLTGVAAGTYTVTVTDASLCTSSASYTVSQPTTLALTSVITNVNCNGATTGAIDLTVSGGTPNYTYLWSNSATTQDLTGIAAGTYTVTVTDANLCTSSASYTVSQPTTLALTSAITNVNCNGATTGAIDLTVSGGTPNYTYLWSNSATTQDLTGIAAGAYTVTVTDANLCTSSASYTVSQPTTLALTSAITNVNCNGATTGAIDLTVSGGTPNYTYLWSNSSTTQDLTGVAAGTYTVTVTDGNSCTRQQIFSITQPSSLTVGTSSTPASCGVSNGTATATPAGGVLNYTYLWNTGGTSATINALAPATYTVTVTDGNSCTRVANVVVSGLNSPVIVITSQTNVNCNGASTGAINITVSGGTPNYTYLWSNSSTTQDLTGIAAGTYTVTVTDASLCTSSASYTVSQPTTLALTSAITNVNCNGATTGAIDLTVSGGTPNYTYLWSNSSTTQDLTGVAAGTYTVTVTDGNSCTRQQIFSITQPSSLTVGTSSTPASCGVSNGTATATPAGGVLNYTYLWSTGGTSATINALAPATYTVTVTDGNSCTRVANVVVSGLNSPVIVLTSQTNVNCNGASTGAINITVSGGTPNYTYLWSNSSTTQDLTGIAAGTYTVTVTDASLCTSSASYTVSQPTTLALTSAITNVNCNGATTGAIDLTVSGGTPNYTYLWSNSSTTQDLTGVAAGTYTVTVTDASLCTSSASYSVSQPATLALTSAITNVNCNGATTGAIDLTVSGGTPNYTYLWSNSATTQDLTGIVAGTYTVTVTDGNSCTRQQIFSITQPSSLTVGTSSTPASCGVSNGTATATPAGGVLNYTYLWSTGGTSATINALAPATYTVTVTDGNSCTRVANVVVSGLNSPVIVLTSQTNVNCNGASTGSINITVSGGTPNYTYLWSNSATTQDLTGIAAGIYTVTVTDANLCTSSASYTVSQPTTLALTSAITNVNCNGATTGAIDLTVSGGTPNYTYLWSNSSTTQDLTGVAAGTYTVTVTDASLCTSSASYSVSQPATLALTSAITNVNCNGATTGAIDLTVSGGTPNYTYLWSNSSTTQDLTGVAAGTYTVTVTDGNSCTRQQIFSITQPSSLTVGTSSTPASCGVSNGTATAAPTGGVLNYTYLWNTGGTSATINALAPATYTVTVTDGNSCTRVANVIVSGLNSPVIVLTSQTNVNCNGASTGAINITVSGGTPNYTYLWSNSATTQDLTGIAAGTYTVTVTDASLCTSSASYTVSQPTTLVLTSAITNVNCNGATTGAIDLTVSGGTPNYTYLWSNSSTTQDLTGVAAGTYTVTVTDGNSCTQQQIFSITQPSSLIVGTSSTPASCGVSNGTATATPSGGVLNYTYLWNTGGTSATINALAPATYTVTVTDGNSCTRVTNVIVSGLNSPVIVLTSQTNVNCNGASTGAINITVSGGTPNYTYLWSNSSTTQDLTGIAAGTYTVTVTDANLCTSSASYTVSQPTLINTTFSNIAPTCNNSNGSITAIPSGGTPSYTYLWSTGSSNNTISNLVSGTYTVTVTDINTCSRVFTNSISGAGSPIVVTDSVKNVLCNGGNNGAIYISINSGTNPHSYLWSNNATTQDIINLTAGNYSVTITDAAGCTVQNTYNITQPSFLSLANFSTTPATCNQSNGSAIVNPIGGILPYSYLWSTGATTQQLSGVIGGSYSITVTDFNGCTRRRNISVPLSNGPDVTLNTQLDVSCNGGTNGAIDINVTGGVLPYTYLWSNGATTQDVVGLSAGNITITVTDFTGCSFTETFEILQPLPISNVSSIIPSSCGQPTGSISLTTVGGTSPYTYQWSNGGVNSAISGVLPGIYTVTVTDFRSCTFISSYTVNTSTGPTIVLDSIRNTSCPGNSNGGIFISVTNGLPNYQYLWSNGSTIQDPTTFSAGTYTVTVTDLNLCTATLSATVGSPQPFNLVFSSNNASCNISNGSASVVVSGGTSPYTYLWETGSLTNSIVNQSAGIYSVTITDVNGCVKNDSIQIGSNSKPIIQLVSQVDPLCYGNSTGSLTINVTGGVSPYNYSWSNGGSSNTINNLIAGTYTITVTDQASCSSTETYIINQPDSLQILFSSTNENCNKTNGTIIANIVGGTFPYNYLWSNGFTSSQISSLTSGTYTLTVTDQSNCQTSLSSTIINIPAPIISISSIQNISCNGASTGAIDITVSGGEIPYTYLWSNGSVNQDISGVVANFYSITVTDFASCTSANSATIIQPDAITLQVTTNNAACGNNNGSIIVSPNGGAPSYTFLWSNGGTTNSLNNLSAGSYTVTVTDLNSCSITQTIFVNNLNGPQISLNSKKNVSCYAGNDGELNVQLTLGTSPYTYNWSNGGTSAVNSNLSAGIYTLTVTDFNNCITSFTDSISQPDSLSLTSIITNGSCNANNGIISTTVSGGTLPYTYNWSNSAASSIISNLSVGNYTVTVTDFLNCTVSSVYNVTSSGIPIISLVSIDSASCNNGSDGAIDIDVSNGLSPYTYTWTNTLQTTQDVSNLIFGGYTVIVSDFTGCTSSQSYIIGQPSSISISFPVVQNAACGVANGLVVLDVSGGSPGYNFLWSNGSVNDTIQNLIAGSYTVTVSDSKGCVQSEIANISNISGPSIISVDSGNVSCPGFNDGFINIIVNGGTPPYSYSWSNLPNTTPNVNNLIGGIYTLTVIDMMGCIAVRTVTISSPDPIVINALIPQLNPPFNLTCNNSNDGSVFLNVTGGSIPYNFVWSNGSTTQNVSNLNAGNYTVFITDDNGCSVSSQYIVSEPPQLISNAGNDLSLCGINTTTLNANTPTYGIGVWSVSTGGNQIVFSDSTSPNSTVNNLPQGDLIFTWTVQDQACAVSSQVLISVSSAIQALAGIDRKVCDDNANLNATRPQFGYGYWITLSPNVLIEDSSKAFTPISNLNYGNNYFQWTVINGECRDSAKINIFRRDSIDCLSEILMPTGFSPNNDGFNDEYIIKGIDDFQGNSFTVYNRWGNIIFERNNYRNNWKGLDNNDNEIPDGTYFVVFKYARQQKVYKSYVDLRR